MKIIYLDQYFNTPEMPGGTRSYEMARRLVGLGHEVHMITTWREPEGRKKRCFLTTEAGIKVHWYPIPYSNKMGFYARIFAFLTFVFTATFRALKIKSDVLFASSTPLTIAIPAIVASKLKRLPMVFEVRDLWPEVPIALGILKNPLLIFLSRCLEKFAYFFASDIVALAPGMKDAVLKVNRNASVTVIPNGCDFELFEQVRVGELREKYQWLQGKKVVLYPGTIGRVNNVEYLVAIAEKMQGIDPNVFFVVVGDGIMAGEIRRIAQHYKVLDRNFYMIGEVSKREIAEWFHIANLVAVFYKAPLCATANSVQNKFFDALSAGKPVVFEHDGWSVNMLEALGGAIRLSDSNPFAAATTLAERLSDDVWYKKACFSSRKLGKDRFDRNNLVKDLEQILWRSISR